MALLEKYLSANNIKYIRGIKNWQQIIQVLINSVDSEENISKEVKRIITEKLIKREKQYKGRIFKYYVAPHISFKNIKKHILIIGILKEDLYWHNSSIITKIVFLSIKANLPDTIEFIKISTILNTIFKNERFGKRIYNTTNSKYALSLILKEEEKIFG